MPDYAVVVGSPAKVVKMLDAERFEEKLIMKKVKITILKCAYHKDLVDQCANPGLGSCDFNREGMTSVSNGWQKPDGLCDNAWKSMMEYVFALAHGGGNFYDGEMRDPKKFIASCNDGFRPVSYLIESMDEDIDQMFE